ncbi:hypothetical protein BDV10DRAFT_182610 [Aspergillus recurvatus]
MGLQSIRQRALVARKSRRRGLIVIWYEFGRDWAWPENSQAHAFCYHEATVVKSWHHSAQDDTKTPRNIVVTWTLRFNDVLDADKLHASLSRLLGIGDWRKLGGRLRLKENGHLEIHVPQPFTEDRPPVSYSHQTLAVDIEDHPLAKSLPKATEVPSIQPGPESFRAFAAPHDAPATLEDFIYEDKPQLSLFITSFNNATLVALSWPYTLMDVMGQQALLHEWSLVLAGRESEVPPMLGAREDVLCAAADTAVEKEEFKLGKMRLNGRAMLKFGL